MNLRKSLLAALPLLTVAALTACGAAPAQPAGAPAGFSADHPVSIEFWHTFTGPMEANLTGLVDEFEATHPGITVTPVYQPYDSMLQALQTSVAAGKPPAMAQLELTQTAQMASFGALASLPDLVGESDAAALAASMIPSIAEANSYDGTLYTVPFGYNSNVLYYNTALVTQAGLTPADLPTTWAELTGDAERLTQDTNGDGTPEVRGYAFPAQAPWILEVRLWQSGAALFSDDNARALFDSPQAVSTFAAYRDLVAGGGAEMVQTDSSLNQLVDLFAAGKVAMFEQSSTAMANITGKAGFDVGVARFPTMGDQVYSLGGYNLGVFKDAPADQQAAAAEFQKWWATPEVAAKWTSVSNYMPGIQAAQDTDTLKAWVNADPRRAVAAEQLPHARPRPNLPGYPQIATELADAFQATLSGQGDAQSNLTSAARKADQIISASN